MNALHLLRRQWLLGLFYFGAAALVIGLTRIEGGVSHLWGATAVLLAALVRTAPSHWWAPVLACVLPASALTLFIGLGPLAVAPFALINAGEAFIAAWLLLRLAGRSETLGSQRWLRAFVAASLAAPLLLSPLVGATLWALGREPLWEMFHYVTGHALGNLTFTPLALMFTGPRARKAVLGELRARWKDAVAVIALSLTVSIIVFGQNRLSMMFLASLFAVFATFRLGRAGASISVAVLALTGAFATSLHKGPIAMMDLSHGGELLMFQFYLAATLLTVLPVAADLRARQTLLRRVRDSEERFRVLAEHSSDILMHLTVQGDFRYVSPAIERLGGWKSEALIGRSCAAFVYEDDLPAVIEEHQACVAQPGVTRRYQHRALLANGSYSWVEAHACALVDEGGRVDGVISLLRDVSETRSQQEQWQVAALTDLLTGLPNRRAFEDKVRRRLRQGRPGRDCLALLDLDRFKSVNDTYGHDAGDAVLRGFGEAARRLVRNHDTVARLGGEEFVILFEETSLEQAYQVCDRLRRLVGQTPFATPAGPLRVTVSGGVAEIGRGGLEPALKAADEALYRAKKGGRDRLLLAA